MVEYVLKPFVFDILKMHGNHVIKGPYYRQLFHRPLALPGLKASLPQVELGQYWYLLFK